MDLEQALTRPPAYGSTIWHVHSQEPCFDGNVLQQSLTGWAHWQYSAKT